jgi:short-subunit dehydrogenase
MSTALITGASSGIGRELARIHARRGGDVVAVARSADTLAALRDELQGAHGVTVHVVPSDLSQPGAGARVHDEVVAAGIDVDVLINNAGFGGRGRFDQRDWADDLAMIHVNVVALTELTRMFVPAMVARNRGRILNVSSTAAVVPGPLQAVYYATKAYVTSFSNAVAGELHDSAVTVTTPMPGVTDTGFAATSGMADTGMFDRTFTAEEVARAGYDAMVDGKLNVFAGVTAAQRALLHAAPVLPTGLLMDQVRRQEVPSA